MLKQFVSKATGESKPEAYHSHPPNPELSEQLLSRVGYVEDFDVPRTKLADCFSILLCHELLQKRIALGPFTMATVGIDMPRRADIDETAPPSNRTMFGMGQRSEWVIGAGNHKSSETRTAPSAPAQIHAPW